jgi:hypothetical protein
MTLLNPDDTFPKRFFYYPPAEAPYKELHVFGYTYAFGAKDNKTFFVAFRLLTQRRMSSYNMLDLIPTSQIRFMLVDEFEDIFCDFKLDDTDPNET